MNEGAAPGHVAASSLLPSDPLPNPIRPSEWAALACSIGLVPLNSTMLAVAVPAIASDLAADPGPLMQWLVASYLLVNIVAQNPGGKLSDLWGHARALTLGQLVFAAGSVIGYWGSGLLLLVAARVLMAVGGALMVASAMATIRIRLPPARRAKAFGLMSAVMGLSAAIGPLVGGEVANRFGWPALFLVNVIPLAVAGGLRWQGGHASQSAAPRHGGARFDLVGSALLGAALAMVVIGFSVPAGRMALLCGGLALLVVFGLWEHRVQDPVVDLRLFMRPAFSAGTLVIGLQNFAMYALLFELPLVFSHSFGATSAQSGRTLLALTLAMVTGSLAIGGVAVSLGSRSAAVIGASVALAGGVLLAMTPLSSATSVIPALLLLGLGLGLTTPAANAAAMSAALPQDSGMAAAVSSTMRHLGGIAGIAVVGTMMSGDDLVAAHQRSSVIFAAALAIALVLTFWIPRKSVGE